MDENSVEGDPISPLKFHENADNNDYASVLNENREADKQIKKASEKFSKRQVTIVALLSLSAFFVTVCFSIIVPFFPEEAAERGASEWMIGFILSVYELAAILSSSAYGKYADVLGLKFMIITGSIVLSASTMLFGILAYVPNGVPFIILCLVVRTFQGLSGAAVQTAMFSIIAKQFPGKVTVVVGILETGRGFAFIFGPVVGGLLYQAGGFLLPFLVFGFFGCFIAILCWMFLISQPADDCTVAVTYWKLLRIPQVWVSITSILAVSLSMSFFDLTMAQQMDLFGINAAQKGLMMCFISITYMIMAPIWGHIVDKTRWIRGVMTVGALLSGIGLLLLGPSPLLPVDRSLWLMALALVILGVGIGAQTIPPFTDVLHLAKCNGFPDDTNTFGLVSGMVNSCYPIGAFVGPSVGGFVVSAIGFPWSVSGLAAMDILLCVFMLLDWSFRFGCNSSRDIKYQILTDTQE